MIRIYWQNRSPDCYRKWGMKNPAEKASMRRSHFAKKSCRFSTRHRSEQSVADAKAGGSKQIRCLTTLFQRHTTAMTTHCRGCVGWSDKRADDGIWTRDLFLTKEVLYRWAKTATFSISSGAKVYNKNEITKKSADFYRRMRSRFSSYLCKWHKINSLVFYTGCVFSCQAGKCIGFSDLTIYFYKQKKAQLISV